MFFHLRTNIIHSHYIQWQPKFHWHKMHDENPQI
nr:MAG TPA: hypothetical protein [Caudoviricetes sp.]